MKKAFLFVFIVMITVTNCMSEDFTVYNLRPSVVKTVPQCGDLEVDPDLKTVTVTFSKDMITDRMWSWCSQSEDSFPEIDQSKIRYLDDSRTCVLPVKLKPNKTYVIWINSQEYMNFKDLNQQSAFPYMLVFKTSLITEKIKILDAIDCAEKWLKLVDNKRYSKSWYEASAYMKSKVSSLEWEKAMSVVRKQIGNTISRTIISNQLHNTLPGAPYGKYCVIKYKVNYEYKKSAIETITPMIDVDGRWRVSGYFIK